MNTAAPRKSIREAARDLRDAWNTPIPRAHAEGGEVPAAPAKRKWSTLPKATLRGKGGEFQLYPDSVDHLDGLRKTTIKLADVEAVTIEDGAALEARITATRLVLIGVFALAFRKRKGGEQYLTIESTDGVALLEVPRKSIPAAQRFAAQVRTAAKTAAA